MARIPERVSIDEMLEILKKQWLDAKDIRKLGSIGYQKALKIRKEITEELEERNCFVPNGLVPNECVVKYLNINLKYLQKISQQ